MNEQSFNPRERLERTDQALIIVPRDHQKAVHAKIRQLFFIHLKIETQSQLKSLAIMLANPSSTSEASYGEDLI